MTAEAVAALRRPALRGGNGERQTHALEAHSPPPSAQANRDECMTAVGAEGILIVLRLNPEISCQAHFNGSLSDYGSNGCMTVKTDLV